MIYEDELIFIQKEQSQIPWIKIFTKTPFIELSDCDEITRNRLFEAILIAERAMIEFYKPKKINIASFANYVPRVHFHVMARFENDDFFPEPMWGKKQRDGQLNLPDFDEFCQILIKKLSHE